MAAEAPPTYATTRALALLLAVLGWIGAGIYFVAEWPSNDRQERIADIRAQTEELEARSEAMRREIMGEPPLATQPPRPRATSTDAALSRRTTEHITFSLLLFFSAAVNHVFLTVCTVVLALRADLSQIAMRRDIKALQNAIAEQQRGQG